jgi:hypothetical protein
MVKQEQREPAPVTELTFVQNWLAQLPHSSEQIWPFSGNLRR